MTISKRERNLLIGAAVAGAVYVLYSYAVSPLIDNLKATSQKKDDCLTRLNDANRTLRKRDNLEVRWNEMLRGGLQGDPFAAAAQIRQFLHDKASESGLPVPNVATSFQPVPKDQALGEIAFTTEGDGTMDSIARLLYRLQFAPVPLKILHVEINSKKPAVDDLKFRINFSTVYLPSAGGPRPTTQTTPASRPSPTSRPGPATSTTGGAK